MAATIDGLVLCTAGEHRLAFHAKDISGIDVWQNPVEGAPYARTAWKLPPAPGRLLIQDDAMVVVDTLEISSDSAPLLLVPPALQRAAGGALFGFIHLRGHLWPLVKLTPFARFLEAQPK